MKERGHLRLRRVIDARQRVDRAVSNSQDGLRATLAGVVVAGVLNKIGLPPEFDIVSGLTLASYLYVKSKGD
jgi:hypothetical protein